MTTNQWDEDYDDEGQNGQQQRSKGNSLRDKLETALAENKALKERVDRAEATAREATVSGLVKEKKLDPKIVKLMPKDIEPTKAAIDAWLEEYGDLFKVSEPEKGAGNSQDETDGGEGGDEPDEYANAMQQIQTVQARGTAPAKQSDVLAKLNDPNLTRDELMAMIMAAGGGPGTG